MKIKYQVVRCTESYKGIEESTHGKPFDTEQEAEEEVQRLAKGLADLMSNPGWAEIRKIYPLR